MDIYKSFNSLAEFFGYLDKFGEPSEYDSSGTTYRPEWQASSSFSEAKERCLRGDDELAKALRGCDKLDIHVPSQGTRKKIVTGVTGFAPHVPNFLAGVPNNMIFVKEQKIQKKVITVMYGCNTHFDEKPETIAQVSARVLSCIMSLERKGYRINLYAVNCAEKRKSLCGFSVKIKDSGQHIDVLKIAFPFLSAAWNRRFGFRFREVNKWRDMGSSVYGNELRSYLDDFNVKYDIALSFYDAKNINNVEQLEKLFINAANKLNK